MYGAVLFDNDKDNGAGWAAVAGGEAFRFQHPFDLETEPFQKVLCWWTNSTWQWTRGHRLLKPSDYLKPSMDRLHAELGLSIAEPSKAVTATAEIFARVMGMARDRYDINPGTRLTLADEFKAVLFDRESPPDLIGAHEAGKSTYQSWVTCSKGKVSEHASLYHLTLPRLNHARSIIATPVPKNYWSFMPGTSMPPESVRAQIIAFNRKPVLVQVEVGEIHPGARSIIRFDLNEEGRAWLSQPEFFVYQSLVDMKIVCAYTGGDYEPSPVRQTLVADEPFESVSISSGILAANYALALSSPQPGSSGEGHQDPDAVFSARCIWLAATDRLLTMTAALTMHRSGYLVHGYGQGTVSVECPREHKNDFKVACLRAGLEAPLSLYQTEPEDQ